MMKRFWNLSVLSLGLALALVGCGKSGGTAQNAPPVTQPGKLTLFSWGRADCLPCQAELKGITKALSSDPALKGRVTAVLYVPVDDTAPEFTDEEIKAFQQGVAPGFELRIDRGWEEFRKDVRDSGRTLPADIVVDSSKNVKLFSKSNSSAPTADIIVNYLKSKLQ